MLCDEPGPVLASPKAFGPASDGQLLLSIILEFPSQLIPE